MNPSERGIQQTEERLTRRELLKITGLAAAALVLAGGCAEVELPQATAIEESGKPQVPEPQRQIDEDAARDLSLLYMAAIGAALFFLRGIR